MCVQTRGDAQTDPFVRVRQSEAHFVSGRVHVLHFPPSPHVVCSRHVPGGHHSSPAAPTPPGALSLSVGPRTLSVPSCTRRPRRAGPFLLTEGSKETARRPPKEGRKWFRLHPCDNTELKRSRSAAGASALESGELNADPSRPCVSAAPVSSAAASPRAVTVNSACHARELSGRRSACPCRLRATTAL